MQRLAWLDALRGWAIFLVVLVHVGQIATVGLPSSNPSFELMRKFTDLGQYGVQLFYVVSAITICLTLTKLVSEHGLNLRTIIAWYLKRAFRLAPLFYLVVFIYAVFRISKPDWIIPYGDPNLQDLVSNLLFVHNWVPSAINSVVPGAWSLGVEFAFYLIAPFLIFFQQKKASQFMVLCILTVVSLLASFHFSGGSVENNMFYYFWFPTQFSVFVAGIIICVWYVIPHQNNKASPNSIKWSLLLPAAAFAFMGSWFGTLGQLDHTFAPLFFGICFAYLTMALAGTENNLVVNVVSTSIGKISYGIYLLHYIPILILLADAKLCVEWLPDNGILRLCVLLCVVMISSSIFATFVRRAIELPGIAIGNKLAKRILESTSSCPETESLPIRILR